MTKISNVKANIIKDSRNEDTLETEIFFDTGISGLASVPQGKSTGEKEAISLFVNQAINNIETLIKPAITGKNFDTQQDFDNTLISLDGTKNKSHLGANAILCLSLAFARGQAHSQNKELYQYIANLANTKPRLPAFYMNLIEGGKHAKNNLDWQEYLIVVKENDPQDSLKIGKDIFEKLGEKLKILNQNIAYGDEGGYDTNFSNNEEPLKILNEAIQALNYQDKVKLALDIAANSFYNNANENYIMYGGPTSVHKLMDVYKNVIDKYSIISIEDPFAENHPEHYATLRQETNTVIIGDDLTATNPELINKALSSNAISGIIVKPNQIGTLSETIDAIKIARENKLKIIISHRSGETLDDFIADLAYGIGAFGLKAGAPKPPERMTKYKRVVEIEKIESRIEN